MVSKRTPLRNGTLANLHSRDQINRESLKSTSAEIRQNLEVLCRDQLSFITSHNARTIDQSLGAYSSPVFITSLISRSAQQSPASRGLNCSPNAPSSPQRLSAKVYHHFSLTEDGLLTYPPTADLVQELYLRELKAYKQPQLKASDAEGQVHKFSAPKVPKSPEETDIANELKAYEASTVELEGQPGTESGSAPINEDWFEEEPEDDDHSKH